MAFKSTRSNYSLHNNDFGLQPPDSNLGYIGSYIEVS